MAKKASTKAMTEIESLKDIIRRARQAEERTYTLSTGRKPKGSDSSEVWRILSEKG